ncbi:hypothetical protein [Absiella sp. AM29-15]|uniref:hypothetical protein n=1 Tax=Absiella sp. AM29-15 TaxID=2292278 RepID=UPI000E41ACD5|nr:hypothetical protein [Absiella sp. AM29-15]RGC49153.1 hypothetical protein DW761_13595 [Absiella sp. AM29-15]
MGLASTLGLFDIVCEVIEDVSVIKILVSSGLEKQYYIKNQGVSLSGCFTRIGTSTQPMTTALMTYMPEEFIQPYIIFHSTTRFVVC